MKCIQVHLAARNENSNKMISKYLEYIQVSKNRFWRCSPAEQDGYDPHIKMRLNVFKHHLPRTSTFVEMGSKASPEPPRTKSIRWALMPSTPMPQPCRFRCVRVRLIFNISASAWRNATVQCSSSISQTIPPSPPHLGPFITAVSIARQIDVDNSLV